MIVNVLSEVAKELAAPVALAEQQLARSTHVNPIRILLGQTEVHHTQDRMRVLVETKVVHSPLAVKVDRSDHVRILVDQQDLMHHAETDQDHPDHLRHAMILVENVLKVDRLHHVDQDQILADQELKVVHSPLAVKADRLHHVDHAVMRHAEREDRLHHVDQDQILADQELKVVHSHLADHAVMRLVVKEDHMPHAVEHQRVVLVRQELDHLVVRTDQVLDLVLDLN